jgi:hypothetical protein
MAMSDNLDNLLRVGYWRNELSGVLQPAMQAYLNGDPLTQQHVSAIRAYLRQWIASPVWAGAGVDGLRDGVDSLTNRAQIDRWLDRAEDLGIDPL